MYKILLVSLFFLLTSCYNPAKMLYDDYGRQTLTAKAEAGDSDAQYRLGESYCCGPQGYYYDTMKALHWWCKAALQGHAGAAFNVGNLYENSYKLVDVPLKKNDAKAWMWYNVAANAGYDEAESYRDNLDNQMTPANLAKAEELLAHWNKTRCGLLEEVR